MTTPDGFDPRYDPTAPSYDPTAPTYETPSYETPSPSFEKPSAESPSSAWPPPEPADTSGAGWFLAPPSASALPPLPGEPDFRPDAAYQPGPTYQRAPMYQPPPVGPRRSSQRAAIAIVLGTVVVLALAVVGIGLVFRSDSDDRRAASPVLPTSSPTVTPPTGSGTPTRNPAATGTTTPSGSSTPSGAAEVTVPAVTPGFQGALSPKENVAYDVPTGWEIRTPGTLVGFEDNDGKPVAIMHGVSTYKPGACPDVNGSNRGNTGFATAGTLAPAVAAQRGVKLFADGAALNEDGTTAPVTTTPVVTIRIGQGTITAKMATATVSPPASAPCGASKVLFTSVAFRTTGGTALFIMYLDQGTPDALSPTLAKQIISSIRPYTG